MNGPVTKTQRILGGNSNPFDAFLLTQGLKTLELGWKDIAVMEWLLQNSSKNIPPLKK
jgi:O-acetylhomoserine/O-acetylserine sulfhydrylase-like pyridoxal-dependent enzyme